EPAKRQTASRRKRGVFIQYTLSVSKKKPAAKSLKLKGVLNPSADKLLVGDKNESDQSEDAKLNKGKEKEFDWVYSDEDDDNDDNNDDDDDQSIDIEKTNDERSDFNEEYVEFEAHEDEYMHDNVDEEMENDEVIETKKDDEELSDKDKAKDEKTEELKGDDQQDRVDLSKVDQATALVHMLPKEMHELPSTSSGLSVSSDFGNQFLTHFSDISLTRTLNDSTETEINSLLDVEIQQEVPKIQSPSKLYVPMSVIPELKILSQISKITTVTPVTSAPPTTPTIIAITTTTRPTTITTPLPPPPITNVTQFLNLLYLLLFS
ncbi:hypothetical protein Tco_0493452, partial [Tanacetum coccineum]